MGYYDSLRTNEVNRTSNNPYSVSPQSTFGSGQASYGYGNVNVQGVDIPESTNPWSNNNLGGFIQGGVGAIGSGVGFFNEVRDEINEYRDARFTQADTTINGVPSYSGVSSLGAEASAIDPSQAGKGLGVKGALAGAQAGGSFGLIGAGIGAVGGLIGGLFGKKKAKNEAIEAKQRANKAFLSSQQNYNEDVEDYYQGVESQRQEVQGERNYAKRLYGTNQYRDPFRQIIG